MTNVRRPPARFFLLHGDDEAAIELSKTAIIDEHLAPDLRDENFREFPTSPGTPLKRVLDDVMGELATVSFLPDSPRVVVLYTVTDLIDGGKSKAAKAKGANKPAASPERAPAAILAEFVEKEMPGLNAVLIMIAIEDPEKWKRLNFDSPLVQIAARWGTLKGHRDESPQFAFFDALAERRADKAIPLWREWIKRAGAGNPRPYQMLAAQMRLLIQAKILASNTHQARGLDREAFARDCLPPEADRSILRIQPEFRREKLLRAAQNFTFQELNHAHLRLLGIMKFLIPVSNDVYVPDKATMSEIWMLDLMQGRMEGAA